MAVHLCFISGSSDPAQSQNLIIENSSFTNSNMTTGGNGGALYFQSPGNLDTLMIRLNQFSGLNADGIGWRCITLMQKNLTG